MERIVVEYLANAVWQIPLLAAGVSALLWALGSDVQTRHRAWLAVLVVAVLMPLRGMNGGEEIVTVAAPPAPGLTLHHAVAEMAIPADDISYVPAEPAPAPKRGLVIGAKTTRWLMRIYGAVLVFAAWRILRSWVAAQGLLRRSRSIHLAPRAMAIFAQAAEAQGIRLPRLRQSDETVSPVVIGAVRPVLLLPAGFDALKDDEILAALSHEFAHLARRDYLVNLLCQIVALPVAWHPAVHVIQKRIRDTREMLCDAVAAGEMASPVRYATCLVAFALRAIDNRDGALATQGMSMFDNRILEERILQLTQTPTQPEPSTRLARLAGATVGLAAAVALALLVHVTPTLADTAPTESTELPAPVQLAPQVDLPPIPPQPEAPAAPVAPPAPPAPTVSVHHHHEHATAPSADMQRAIADEARQRGEHERDQALKQAEKDRERALKDADRQREEALRQAEREREKALEQANQARESAREAADRDRERAQEQREAAREAAQEAREQAAEIKRQLRETIRASEAVRKIDLDAIRKQIADATSKVRGPEFKAQMAELETQMQALHDNMTELHEQMKQLDKEIAKSGESPM